MSTNKIVLFSYTVISSLDFFARACGSYKTVVSLFI
jgi:hypothetical protein